MQYEECVKFFEVKKRFWSHRSHKLLCCLHSIFNEKIFSFSG